MRAAWLFAIAATAACAPAARPGTSTDAAMPIATADSAIAPLCYAPSTTGEVMPGTSTIEDCAIWNNLARMTGQVTVSRDQTMLSIAFDAGSLVYTGTVDAGAVSLSYYALHDFTDGCEWRATETLTGTLAEATCQLTLTYHYAETVEVDNGDCATPCSADGSFSFDVTPLE